MTDATSYAAAYQAWQQDPAAWWADEAEGISWTRKWDRIFDPALGAFGQWFPGAMLNTCYNCLDRHVEAGQGARTALIYDSPVTGQIRHFSYAELLEQTAKLAGALAALGVTKGDRVVIYMPMVPEA